jgi:hypothetical protein
MSYKAVIAMTEKEREEKMEAITKPIRPMIVEFESDQDEQKFATWAVTKEKTNDQLIKRVRANFAAYRKMKRTR